MKRTTAIVQDAIQSPEAEATADGGFVLPEALADLGAAIDAARDLLEFEDNWDDMGSPAFAASTWERAVSFLARSATAVWLDRQARTVPPRVLPGPAGSIDIHWRTPRRELLINVPADLDEPATYYGDDGAGTNTVSGTLDTSVPNVPLLVWLMA